VKTFDYLVSREIENRLETAMEGLSRGVPQDWAEYCKLVGEIRGLRYAQQAVINARSVQADSEEDEA
jgi:hypothetical protein